MAKAAVIATILLSLSSIALADRLILNDGRTFNGVVTYDGDVVRVETPFGSMKFTRDEVREVAVGDLPETEFSRKLAALPADNAPALAELAQWAARNSLPRQAEDLYTRVLKIDPENASARLALGYVKVEGNWRTFEQALEIARNKLDVGQHQQITDLLPALEPLAVTKEKQLAIREIQGLTHLRGGKFAAAQKVFEDLAEKSTGAAAIRAAAIIEIIKESPDGMYLLTEAYPPAAELLGDATAPVLKPGPASLAEPMVLQAALRDRARKDIEAGRKAMDEAQKIESTDADAAKTKYSLAAKAFDRSDALVPNIAKSYRIEIARRRITAMRKDTDAEAKEFDKEMSSLGKRGMSAADYRNKVLRLIYLVDNLRQDLKEIIAVAKPFSRELVLEMKWAELDLKKIEEMRQVLTGELDGKK